MSCNESRSLQNDKKRIAISVLKANCGSSDLLQLAFCLNERGREMVTKTLKRKTLEKKVGNMTVRELKKLIKDTVFEVMDPDYGLELRPEVEKELRESLKQKENGIPLERWQRNMKALTISSKGQIAIPKEIRDSLHIKEGDQLVYRIERGRIVLEPVVNLPRSQAYFWTPEVQEKIKELMRILKG